LSYYSATVTLTAEGDTQLSDETVEGLGTTSNFIQLFFGSIINIASPQKNRPTAEFGVSTIVPTEAAEEGSPLTVVHYIGADSPHFDADVNEEMDVDQTIQKSLLTVLLPDPGYFAAGAIAGVISRTATAPLDRLKVYLIANTNVAVEDSVQAVKKGNAVAAVKHVGRPLIEATKELWRAGGIRSLFAGMLQ
jgi:solute carrier family 25 phosphate transporter 23/24/25/41